MTFAIESIIATAHAAGGKSFDKETVFAVSAAIEQAAGFTVLPSLRAGG